MYLTLSRQIPNIHNISLFLGGEVSLYKKYKIYKNIQGIVVWGKKKNQEAQELAKKFKTEIIYLEDGFLRSLATGKENKLIPLSLIIDNKNIYYDCSKSSQLEDICNNLDEYLQAQDINKDILLQQASQAIEYKNFHELSKYNHATENYIFPETNNKKNLLLIDQVRGDLSIQYSNSSQETFKQLFQDALELTNEYNIYIKAHPVSQTMGYLEELYLASSQDIKNKIVLIKDNINSINLLKNIDCVYTVSSLLGLEALLLDKEVHCYGIPFYAGWGLTQDKQPTPRRQAELTVQELFAISYILCTKYINPNTNQETNIFYTLKLLQKQKEVNIKNKGEVYFFSFHWFNKFLKIFPWFNMQSLKRDRIRKYLQSTNNILHFPESVQHAKELGMNSSSQAYVWGNREKFVPGLRELIQELNIPLGHIEDGFVRSLGLGSDCIMPMSLSCDRTGIYYDYDSESELFNILNNYSFNTRIVNYAKQIQQLIIKHNISKYNVQYRELDESEFNFPQDRKKILVIGQVPKDASIVKSTEYPVNSNYRLLKEVRKQNPDAYIIFKVHPDMLARNRKSDRIPGYKLLQYCDYIDCSTNAVQLLQLIDEVHTMTSLTGFEALLRGIPVVTYGRPFYAGWGLTRDYLSQPNRQRELTLEELVAGALILYPYYLNPETNQICLIEDVIQIIAQGLCNYKESDTLGISWARRRWIQLYHIIVEVKNILINSSDSVNNNR